jgi:hypothetical protein
MSYFDLSAIKSRLSGGKPLIVPNKYQVVAGGFPAWDQIYLMAKSVSLPAFAYQVIESGLTQSGYLIASPGKMEKENISIEFYNRGTEYEIFYNEMDRIWSQEHNCVAWHDEITHDLTIFQMDACGSVQTRINYFNCVLTSLSGLEFSYSANDVQTFKTEWAIQRFNLRF